MISEYFRHPFSNRLCSVSQCRRRGTLRAWRRGYICRPPASLCKRNSPHINNASPGTMHKVDADKQRLTHLGWWRALALTLPCICNEETVMQLHTINIMQFKCNSPRKEPMVLKYHETGWSLENSLASGSLNVFIFWKMYLYIARLSGIFWKCETCKCIVTFPFTCKLETDLLYIQ